MAEQTNNTEKGIQDIKSVLKTDKVVMGTEGTIKDIKQNRIATVYLSSNVPEDIEKEISYYAEINDFEVVKLSVPNDELGVLCQKPFFVSVLGVRK
ncbi:MAG: ribosomal L7Ae/L30e/S12e/Gadd45 family protein [Nanobdellota archaeon]